MPHDGEVARIPIMAIADTIREWVEEIRQRKANKKAKREEARAQNQSRLNQPVDLDEVKFALGAMGLDSNELADELDDRFLNNPIGVGCSKSFELPSPTTKDSRSPSASPKVGPVPESVTTVEDNDPLATSEEAPTMQPFKGADQIDWARKKRKGRASEDETEGVAAEKDYLRHLSSENAKQRDLLKKGKVFILKKVRSRAS